MIRHSVAIIDGLSMEISKQVHDKFYRYYPIVDISEASVVITGITPFNHFNYPKITHIISLTTNLNHIVSNGAKVISLKDYKKLNEISSTAEFTMYLLLTLFRGDTDRWMNIGHTLKEKRLGIIGCGRVGEMVRKYAEAFGMIVHGYDIDLSKTDRSLEYVLKTSDVISLHASVYNPVSLCRNGYIIGANELSMMKDNSYLINTSRACLLDEDALIAYSKKFKGIALDTWEDPRLKLLGNIILTSHIGGATMEDMTTLSEWAFNKLVEGY